jgi:CRP-like cAMP-binding protein
MALEEDIAFLGKIPTFRVLGREALRILAISADQRHVRSGEILFEEGEPADGAFVVVYGAVELKGTRDHITGGGVVARAGSLIGETALIVDTLRPASATALEPTGLMRIPRSVFLRMLEGEPSAAAALRKMMSGRLEATLNDLDTVAPLFETGDEEQEKTD